MRSPFLDGIALLERDTTAEESPPQERETVQSGVQVRVVGVKDVPIADGEYAFYQADVVERGNLAKDGSASFNKIDPKRPFIFEVRDRVCAVRSGAFFNPDDPRLEYGGIWFDWTLVRDDLNPDKRFWPHYQKEMDQKLRAGVERFMQHEHITRRPIQAAKPVLLQRGTVVIRATPVHIRVGPFVRYADHERAVIWLETVTPAMVRVRFRPSGATVDSSRYGTTIRAGGRYFAAVELDGLTSARFYDYTIELAPLPAAGAIPIASKEIERIFPTLTRTVAASMSRQMTVPALQQTPWLTFRTLQPRYLDTLRFAMGSCRWYPGDESFSREDAGPDMLRGLGNWLRSTPKQKWPHFLFFGGDQIYADEIGVNHGQQLTRARFAARVPGPVDRSPLRDKLVDGAWAGRFAHRFHAYADPEPKLANRIEANLKKLDDVRRQHPDLREIYRQYPDINRKKALQDRYTTLKNRRTLGGASTEASDERDARQTLAALAQAEPLEIEAEPFRAIRDHWNEGARTAQWRNPMSVNFLVHNFALWALPDFEQNLPAVTSQPGVTVARKPDRHAHPAAERGVHAADFAEYAYLYERAWTSSKDVRCLLAHVPTFLMFDDHEVTDDWNFDISWVRMLHNEKDDFRMWPKTLTDSLAAYWMYQGWCNKAPSQWDSRDPRVDALATAAKSGTDALPQLRRVICAACFPAPKKGATSFQAGTSLDWHYKLPFDPPFLVPDCRSRKLVVSSDDSLRTIDHDDPAKAPKSQTIDDRQIAWMRKILVDEWRGGRVAFIAPSTPLLMQNKLMAFMREPEIAAGAWARGADVAGILAALLDSTKLGVAKGAVLRVFRRARDLEHMIRDKSWRDLWTLVDDMHKKGSGVKTLVLVSGDVHHNYSMTANPSTAGRARPEVLQLTCSGFRTTIRSDRQKWLAEQLSGLPFDIGKRHLTPGFILKDGAGRPDLVLYENAAAVVDVTMRPEVDVTVTYLWGAIEAAKQKKHIYKYTSAAAYLKSNGEPAVAW